MLLSDFDYTLPPELIAKKPLTKRSGSRLLCLDKKSGEITHLYFKDLPDLFRAKDLIIFNDTKVIKARLYTQKPTGGKVEILVEHALKDNKLLAQTKASKTPKIGERLILTNDIWFDVLDSKQELFELLLHAPYPLHTVLEKFGQVPLPPYIKREPNSNDEKCYQTIYAKNPGAVAAPTAGLHFDQKLMCDLDKKNIQTEFITLHVGLGTFQPVRVTKIADHPMHSEYISVSKRVCDKITKTKNNGGKIIAVGTTTVRALETVYQQEKITPFIGKTNIFIYPGYNFCSTDILVTNFHLPKTSLLMLVCAFAGYDNIMRAYQEAIGHKYRFYSYGDAMVILT